MRIKQNKLQTIVVLFIYLNQIKPHLTLTAGDHIAFFVAWKTWHVDNGSFVFLGERVIGVSSDKRVGG